MSNKKTDIVKGHSVIAITREDGVFKAVGLSKKSGSLHLVWTKSCDADRMDWPAFIAECLPESGDEDRRASGRHKSVVVGFNSIGVVFYRLEIPAVREDEVERIVRLQTESKLPLPVEQIEMAYRTSFVRNGQAKVTVAVGRKENLQKFVEEVRFVEPEKILLDCEGLVKTWWSLFSDGKITEPAVVISIARRSARVCLVEAGKLSNAAIIDMGTEDLAEQIGLPMDPSAPDRFVQDIRSVFELFGFADESKVPVYVFAKSVSDKSDKKNIGEFEIIKNIVSALASAGFDASLCDFRFPVTNYLLSTDDNDCLYEYRVPIGLGLMSLDSDEELALFDSLYKPRGAERKIHWLYSLKAACSVTIMMLILSFIVFYLFDTAQLAHLNELKTRVDYGSLRAKHNLMEIVADQRPDVLELLSRLSSVEANGIMLSDIDFKIGQAVKVKGTAGNAEQLYTFQENLLADESFQDVKIQSPQQDEKSKKLSFTITFNYKNFSQRRG